MKLLGSIGATLFCTVIIMVYCQTEEAQTTESPRDFLFVKPKSIVLQKLERNKTRFTDEEKLMILQIHNSYRSLVLPPAANMRELVWDNDLEEYAWNHTQKCTGAHSAGTMVKTFNEDFRQTWKRMGECLYYRVAPWYSILEAMWMYWEEGSKYDIFSGNCTHENTCGHYRVITTSQSSRVGCAINTCDNFTVSKYATPAVFFSCSYDGSYNYWERPYTVGERGSYCNEEKQPYEFERLRFGLCTNFYMVYEKYGFDGNTSIVELPSLYLTTTTTTTPTTSPENSTTISTNFTKPSSNFFSSSTASYTTLTYPHTETSTTISTFSANISTFKSTISLNNTTEKEVITTVYPETSTKQTLPKRTVNHAKRLCVWVSHTLLPSLVLLIAVFV